MWSVSASRGSAFVADPPRPAAVLEAEADGDWLDEADADGEAEAVTVGAGADGAGVAVEAECEQPAAKRAAANGRVVKATIRRDIG
ncbi:hypothetical protein Adu01nite_23500 [Paractinoplanes durhamensis]|uniref:Uncharacterized protein n=1 Tax=Paractinoplanes durhamensis TaxID=113563 RepID=A0ABQ3YU00_9ACTN|nr:hypothetical protein Adu01nite_23500 [Actinoplanes durhamensis]